MGVYIFDAVVMPKGAMFSLLLLSDNKLIDLCSLYHGDTKTQYIFIYIYLFLSQQQCFRLLLMILATRCMQTFVNFVTLNTNLQLIAKFFAVCRMNWGLSISYEIKERHNAYFVFNQFHSSIIFVLLIYLFGSCCYVTRGNRVFVFMIYSGTLHNTEYVVCTITVTT